MKDMKINRFAALAVIAVLVVAAIAVFKGEDIVESASQVLGIQGLGEGGEDEDAADINASIKVDAATLAGKTEAEQAVILAGLATITEEQANAAAVAANPGTTVTETELEVENGGLVYEVELSNDFEVYVDAGTGSVLKSAADDD
jgi:uncharacterized membrane protein YkoI